MLINIVSRVPPTLWERELPPLSSPEFVHTFEPTLADVHVIYGLRNAVKVPNAPANTIFVASEPPEIREYNLATLSSYRSVLAPGFDYLRELPNFFQIDSVAPWWVGANAGGQTHYEELDSCISLSRALLETGFTPARDVISVIVSSKPKTPLQQQRLRLVEFLQSRLPALEVCGEGTNPVGDKADILKASKYHLAVENSLHPNYWTEKLTDPVLMDNVVFYGGHASYRNKFDSASVIGIDPYNLEGTYRCLRESLERSDWEATNDARGFNRALVLNSLSFHRSLIGFIERNDFSSSQGVSFSIPAQHPRSRLKGLIDPIYGRLPVSFRDRNKQ